MSEMRCPECGLPAKIIDRFILDSTSGPFEHVKIRCLDGHWFTPPPDDVELVELEAPVERLRPKPPARP